MDRAGYIEEYICICIYVCNDNKKVINLKENGEGCMGGPG